MLRVLAPAVFVLGVSGFAWAEARDVPSIAYDIMRKDLKTEDWRKFVKKTASHYETWINDNPSGSMKRFLDDKLMPIAMGVPKGEIKTLKKFVHWLALYKEFHEPAPWYLRELSDKNKQDLDNLLADWSWERASALVRKRSGEMTPEEKKKLDSQMRSRKD